MSHVVGIGSFEVASRQRVADLLHGSCSSRSTCPLLQQSSARDLGFPRDVPGGPSTLAGSERHRIVIEALRGSASTILLRAYPVRLAIDAGDEEVDMVTIHDVAKAAGVSISTVSYAMSGRRPVSERTRRRIEESIATLGFEPNAGARMLAGSVTGILALSAPVRPDTHLPAHMRFVSAISAAAQRNEYDLLLLAGGDEVQGIRRVVRRGLIDGVVLYGVASDDDRIPALRDLGAASALIGVPDDHEGLICVDLDFEAVASEAVDRLADLGHRSIGIIGYPEAYLERHSGFMRRFSEAFEKSCRARGVRFAAQYPALGRQSVVDAVNGLRAELPDMSALVLHCNEPVAAVVLRSLVEADLRVPEDLSLLALATSYDPGELELPVSTYPLPLEQMCDRAVAAAVSRIEGDGESGVTLLPPVFIDRGSLAAR